MPGLLQDSIRQSMQAQQAQRPLPGTPTGDDPLANMEDASDEEEQYVSDIWDQVAMRMYRDGATTKIKRMIRRAPEQQKLQAIILASLPFMDAAAEAMKQHPSEPAEDAGQQITNMIVDGVLEIADVSGAAPYSDNLATAALVGVRNAFVQNHPELYGGQDNGRPQSQGSGQGTGGGSSGLRPV